MQKMRKFFGVSLLFGLLLAKAPASVALPGEGKQRQGSAAAQAGEVTLTDRQASHSHRILFIGNSFTFYNQMPQMLQSMASSRKQQVLVGSLVRGGATLAGHVGDKQTFREALDAQSWTHVILQDQSITPAIAPQRTLEASQKICAMLPKTTERVFFLTWGYRDQQQPNSMQPGMQQALSETYVQAAMQNNASIAPVGPAFAECMQQFQKVNLYVEDGQHPSVTGSYLCACVLYAQIFKQTPEGLPGKLVWKDRQLCQLEPAQALALQQQAWRSVRQFSSKQVLEQAERKKQFVNDLNLQPESTLKELVETYGQAQSSNAAAGSYQFKLPHQLSLVTHFAADGKRLQSAMLIDDYAGIRRQWKF